MIKQTITHLRIHPSRADSGDRNSSDERLSQALEEYSASLETAQPYSREQLLTKYCDIADELAACLDSLNFIHEIAPQLNDEHVGDDNEAFARLHPAANLGDFRIIRELGRGGMGVVYEAEQLSLGRRVALKVLPFAAMLDKQQLARFKNEARAAATLDHPNIVAIYSVGCERGVHYYAMQLIEGQSLAQVVEQLRTSHLPLPPGEGRGEGALGEGRGEGQVGAASRAALPDNTDLSDSSPARLARPTADTAPIAHLSTLPNFNSREYYRSVAQLGIQAAEALDHAHQNGILHSDIKPANLLLESNFKSPSPLRGGSGRGADDASHLKLWITDFGLARMEADAGMTMTGDILGTLRYMSPEQALAKRVVVDHRSDIYSLGVTLYELLTLQPAFIGNDRQELLRQIAFEEPRKLRQVNSRLPQDLETILLKAIEKNPADRYATANELARDLERFISERPIEAKRPSLIAVAHKWSTRNRAQVWATAIAFLVSSLVLATSVGWIARDRASRQKLAESVAGIALEDALRLFEQQNWTEAAAAVRRAEDVLAGTRADGPVSDRAKELRKDAEMVLKLEGIRRRQTPSSSRVVTDTHLSSNAKSNNRNAIYADRNKHLLYLSAFKDYGIDISAIGPGAAAARIRDRPIWLELALALDSWAHNLCDLGDIFWTKLDAIARRVDPDPWRNRLRDTLDMPIDDRRAALRNLAASVDDKGLDPRTSDRLVTLLFRAQDYEAAIGPLKAVQRLHPGDFRVNLGLAVAARFLEPPQWRDAVRFNTSAVAIRPDDYDAHYMLGYALWMNGQSDEAISSFRAAIRLDPQRAESHCGLGCVLQAKGLRDDAIASFHEAIRLSPEYFIAYMALGDTYRVMGNLQAAIASYETGIRVATNDTERRKAQEILNHAIEIGLELDGKYEELALRNPKRFGTPELIGDSLARLGKFKMAAQRYEQAARAKPNDSVIAVRTAILQLASGDRKGYETTCSQMLNQLPSDDLTALHRICWACTVSPNVVGTSDQWLPLADRALEDLNEPSLAFYDRGLAAYRIGDWNGTLKFCAASRKADAQSSNKISGSTNFLLESMALYRLGKPVDARSVFDSAVASAPLMQWGDDWIAHLAFVMLRQEAEELIRTPTNDASRHDTEPRDPIQNSNSET